MMTECLSMYIINTIPLVVFVSEISLVRFLIHRPLMRKYHTLSMKYSLCTIYSPLNGLKSQ